MKPGAKVLRSWRDSAFRILALAVCIAALALASIVLLRAELEQRFVVRSAEMLGGDLMLVGSEPPDAGQLEALVDLRQARVSDFTTVVMHDDEMLLVSARAVDGHYPLYGQLHVAADRFAAASAIDHGPSSGEAWVADQVLDRLGLQIGETLQIGRLTLTLAAVVRQEPDQGAGFYSMNPRVLINQDDLAATGVLGPGTRVRHQLMLGGDTARIAAAERALAGTLRPDQNLRTVADAADRSQGPLRQLTLWVSLGVLLVSLLCGAAVFLATSQRVRRRAHLAALLRSFGASRRQVSARLLGEEFLAVVPAAVVGAGLGISLILLVRRWLEWDGPWAATLGNWIALLAGPLVLWLAFALPRLLSLVRVPATDVLGGRLDAHPVAGALELAAALGAPVVLAALLTGSLAELGQLLLLLVLLGALLPALLWPLLKALDLGSRRLPLAGRLAIRRLSRRPGLTLPLLASLTVAMAVLGLAGLVGNQLLHDWRTRLPEQAPNHFVFNLFEEDLPPLEAWLEEHGAISQPLYPIVRGRLTDINQVPVREAVTKENDDAQRALNRDLALTAIHPGQLLPPSNRVIDGSWPPRSGAVSVEKELAHNLGLGLADTVQFVTSQGTLTAQVTSIREVDWDSFEPNFYFMFASDGLVGQDITWLTSFWLSPGDGARLAALLRQLPHITVIDVRALLDQAQALVAQAGHATSLLALLLMLSALLVLGAALLGAQAQRGQDNALLRTLGAGQRLIRRVTWLESLILGQAAALGATLIMLAALHPLAQRLFGGVIPWSPWLLLPACLGLVVTVAGVRLGTQAQRQPPVTLLRQS